MNFRKWLIPLFIFIKIMLVAPRQLSKSTDAIILTYITSRKLPVHAYLYTWREYKDDWEIEHYPTRFNTYGEAEDYFFFSDWYYKRVIFRFRYSYINRPEIIQLKIPFGISKGTEPYYCKYYKGLKEICRGGLVFYLGEKPSCRECAKECIGCIEMAINFGYISFNDVNHLIIHPDILIKKYQKLYNQQYGDNIK